MKFLYFLTVLIYGYSLYDLIVFNGKIYQENTGFSKRWEGIITFLIFNISFLVFGILFIYHIKLLFM